MSSELTLGAFQPHLGSTLSIFRDAQNVVDLEIVSVDDHSNDKVDSFSVLLKSGPGPDFALGSKSYRAHHSGLGAFEMFVSPVNDPYTKKRYLEAVFAQIKER